MIFFDDLLKESIESKLPIRVHFYRDNETITGLVMNFDDDSIVISRRYRYKADAAKAVIDRKYVSYIELLAENDGYYIS